MEKTIKKHYGGLQTYQNDYIAHYIAFLEKQTKNLKVINKIIELLNKYNNEETFNNTQINKNNINDEINDEINMSILKYLLNKSKKKNYSLIIQLNNEFEQSYKTFKNTTQKEIINIARKIPKPRSPKTPVILKFSNGQQTKKKFSFPSLPRFHLPKLRLPRFTQKYTFTGVNNTRSPGLQNLPMRETPKKVPNPLNRFSSNTKSVSTGRLPSNNGRFLTFVGVGTTKNITNKPQGDPAHNFSISPERSTRRSTRRAAFS